MKRVVIVGSGFGGLFAAKALKRADVEVTLISKTASHLFQPLLYQVATGVLSAGEIAPPTRAILRKQKNARTLLGTVVDIDVEARTVTSHVLDRVTVTPYDELIVAAGAGQSYFGNDEFARWAPGMKSVDDALELRGRIYGAFELAELETDPAEIARLLTFVVVGAGPTGVEMAGQILEVARRTLVHDFRTIEPRDARVVLVDFAPQVLGSFGDRLSGKAAERLREIGVELQLGQKVVDMDLEGVTIEDAAGQRTVIPSLCKIWAAGVQASPLARLLAERTGAEIDRAGRIKTLEDLTLPGHPEIQVVGDMAALRDYPGVAQVAIQGGRHAAAAVRSGERVPFAYKDKGSMATISRFGAVASVGGLRFAGPMAWLLWLLVHIAYIVGFKNRLTTVLHWMVSFVGSSRSQRVSTEQQVLGRIALQQAQPFEIGNGARRRDAS
ncbi:MAG: NAD(P)/FAD-dependent oxidoreductase [Sporichthyaceae bacterium]